jgi:hypothetical protein
MAAGRKPLFPLLFFGLVLSWLIPIPGLGQNTVPPIIMTPMPILGQNAATPHVRIVKADPRAISSVNIAVSFSIEGSPHIAPAVNVGDFPTDGVLELNLDGRGATWRDDVSKWICSPSPVAQRGRGTPGIAINKIDPRAISNLQVAIWFEVDGEKHYDFEDCGDFSNDINLVLDGRGGTWNEAGAQWTGNFLAHAWIAPPVGTTGPAKVYAACRIRKLDPRVIRNVSISALFSIDGVEHFAPLVNVGDFPTDGVLELNLESRAATLQGVKWIDSLRPVPQRGTGTPCIAINKLDPRTISDWWLVISFEIEGQQHGASLQCGDFSNDINLDLDGRGGTWNGVSWGDPHFLTNAAAASPGGTTEPPARRYRYNEVQQISSHNSYDDGGFFGVQKRKGNLRQQADAGVRSFELDIHNGQLLGDSPSEDWDVYHSGGGRGNYIGSLSEGLDSLRAWHDNHRNHEVITIWLELCDDWKDGGHMPGNLDNLLLIKLGSFAYCPQYLLYANARPGTLKEAVLNNGNGWPFLDDLRDKFIVVLMSGDDRRVASYLESRDTHGVCFAAPSNLIPGKVLKGPEESWGNAVFYNVDVHSAGDAKFVYEHGFVSRVTDDGGVDNQRDWQTAINNLAHHVATDNIHSDILEPRLVDDRGNPFRPFPSLR